MESRNKNHIFFDCFRHAQRRALPTFQTRARAFSVRRGAYPAGTLQTRAYWQALFNFQGAAALRDATPARFFPRLLWLAAAGGFVKLAAPVVGWALARRAGWARLVLEDT